MVSVRTVVGRFPGIAAARTDAPLQKRQTYVLPRLMLARVFWSFLRRKPRNVWSDCSRANDTLANQPIVNGLDNIPLDGPVVFLPNHYERKDSVWVGWGAIALTSAVGRHTGRAHSGSMHWVMTDTWADCFVGPYHVNPKHLGWVLKGFGDVYGITRMPAHDLPNHTERRGNSATALRSLLTYLNDGSCVAMHPEAGGFETLVQPPPGSGRVMTCLDRRKITMIPVGICEQNDRLVINIGEPIASGSLQGMTDKEAADTVMHHIARLIPAKHHGVYAGDLTAAGDRPLVSVVA